jgi:hypothetical protein
MSDKVSNAGIGVCVCVCVCVCRCVVKTDVSNNFGCLHTNTPKYLFLVGNFLWVLQMLLYLKLLLVSSKASYVIKNDFGEVVRNQYLTCNISHTRVWLGHALVSCVSNSASSEKRNKYQMCVRAARRESVLQPGHLNNWARSRLAFQCCLVHCYENYKPTLLQIRRKWRLQEDSRS